MLASVVVLVLLLCQRTEAQKVLDFDGKADDMVSKDRRLTERLLQELRPKMKSCGRRKFGIGLLCLLGDWNSLGR